MINYINVLLSVLLVLSVCEFLLAGYPAARRQLFNIAFAFTITWIAIKYYVGPDIANYVPYYKDVPSPEVIISGGYESRYEIGFALFCSVCKYVGLTFWGMNLVVTLFYFIPLYSVLGIAKSYNTFALFILATLDYNLMLYELRQSMAVSLLLISFLLMRRRYELIGILTALASILFHKSAIFILIIATPILMLRRTPVDKRAYAVIAAIFLLFLFIPIGALVTDTVGLLPLPSSVKTSILHHINVGDFKQLILPVYIAAIACITYYSDFDRKGRQWHWFTWCCIAIIAVLLQYWFFLNRIRSYILPFIIPYILNVCMSSKRSPMLRQCTALIFVLYSIVLIVGISRPGKSRINGISTVFERTHMSEQTLLNRQMRQAEIYWAEDYTDFLKKNRQ